MVIIILVDSLRTEDDLYFGQYNIAKTMKSNLFFNLTQQLLQTQNSTKEMKIEPNKWFKFKRESDSIAKPMLEKPDPFFDMKQEQSHDLQQYQNSKKEIKSVPNKWFRFKRESDSMDKPMLKKPNPYFDMKQDQLQSSIGKMKSKHSKRFTLATKRETMPLIASMKI